MKVWIDTDIGGDIDDAFTLLLALSSEDIEILGISTVFENTKKRAKIAKGLLKMANKQDIKVYAGCGLPIKARKVFYEEVDVNATPKTYHSVFENIEYDGDDAVESLANTLRHSEENVNILCIGALTNIGLLIGKYPELQSKINHLYIMGTAVGMNLNEFNITCDPEAADIVLNSTVEKTIVSLDVTFRCELSKQQLQRLNSCQSLLIKSVMEMCALWQHGVFLHDPLTLAIMLKPDFVSFVKGKLKVELEGEFSRGKCINLCDFNWKNNPNELLNVSYDVKNLEFTEYFVKQVEVLDKKLMRII